LVFRGLSDQAVFLDAHTLTQAFTISLPAGSISSATSFAFSADSQTLYLLNGAIVDAYSVATRQHVGWHSNIILTPTAGGLVVGQGTFPFYIAMDSAGVLAGPAEQGVGFLDTTTFNTGPVGAGYTNAYLSPPTGPTAGGTITEWQVPSANLQHPVVYFGANQASGVSANGGNIAATTPAGKAGPADVYLSAASWKLHRTSPLPKAVAWELFTVMGSAQ